MKIIYKIYIILAFFLNIHKNCIINKITKLKKQIGRE